jgi:PAS domain S-box-containing protein
VGVAEDVTERKQAEEASLQLAQKRQALAQQNEAHLRLVINTIPTTAWTLLPDGTVDFINQRYLEYTGLSFAEALAEPTRAMHADELSAIMQAWSGALAAGRPYEGEMRLRRADGEYRCFLVRTVPLRDEQGNIVKWYGASTDIEDWKRAEQASRQAAAELQALSRRLVELQESERRALARELHDRLGATLTALSINLGMLKNSHADSAQTAARVRDSLALVKSTAAAIENIAGELRPPMLDDHGLPAALDWYGKQFSQRVGIAVSVQAADADERPAPEVETALFRIAQEALNNVAKHARARNVAVTLWRSACELVMSIADDGVGFADAAPTPQRAGLGLVTMRERAQAIGGRFVIEALREGGTRLTVKVPL